VAGDGRAHEQQRPRYVATGVTRLAAAVVRPVRAARVVGLFSGASGMGKSYGLRVACAETPGVVMVRVDPDSRGKSGFLRALGAVLHPAGGAPEWLTIKAGVQEARGLSLIVVDEAQLLCVSALECVRSVFDGAGCAVLLVGTATLGRQLDPACDPLLGPLAARTAVRCDLARELLRVGENGQPAPWLSLAELKAIVEQAEFNVNREALAALHQEANLGSAHLRGALDRARIATLLARTRNAESDGPITANDVTAAARLAGRDGGSV
jgi:hypothetical protein